MTGSPPARSAAAGPLWRARANDPCPVCGRGRSCSATADGLHLCREPEPPAGWRKIGSDPNGFTHYRRDGGPAPRHPGRPAGPGARSEPVPAAPPGPDLAALAAQYAAGLTARPDRLAALAADLGLPADVFGLVGAMGAGWDGSAWTFPEVDATGNVVGINRRHPAAGPGKGRRFAQVPGGRRGLTVPAGWAAWDGPVFVAEGASDTLALTAARLAAVGRPNAAAGRGDLAGLLAGVPPDRRIVVVADADSVGRTGAAELAAGLATDLGRPVLVAPPPAGTKDMRAWLTHPDREDVAWAARGVELVLHFASAAAPPNPPQIAARPAGGVTAPLTARTLDAVASAPVTWLWPGRVPFGMVTMLDGDPGLGKSAVAFDLAARLTRGGRMPLTADPPRGPAGVLLLCAEDSPAHTLRPRLEAAGADLKRVVIPAEDAAVVIPGDLPAVEALVLERGVKLIVIDPVMSFLAGGIDSNNDQSARQALTPLKGLAERTGAAVLLLRHLNKKDGQGAAYRGGGSIAFTAVARSALVVGLDPADPDIRVLAAVKCNVGRPAAAAAYAIEDEGGMPVVAWGELRPDLSPDDVCTRPLPTGPGRGAPKAKDAQEWLRGRLAAGPVPKADLEAAAEIAGHKWRTVQRAANELGVAACRTGFPARTVWRLPGSQATLGGDGDGVARVVPPGGESPQPAASAGRAEGHPGDPAQLGLGPDGVSEPASPGEPSGPRVVAQSGTPAGDAPSTGGSAGVSPTAGPTLRVEWRPSDAPSPADWNGGVA